MNQKNQMMIEAYREQKLDYEALGEVVYRLLTAELKRAGVMVNAITYRLKTEESLEGKLQLKDEKYHQLSDITDLLGVRIISYFSDDVDHASAIVEQIFEIDRENSVDKRELLGPNAFGYLSVHYICSLRERDGYPREICGKKFEVQIRSALQHTWAEIEHDLGYKSAFGVPREVRREFSRVASLLEIADEQFVRIREALNNYACEIRRKIAEDCCAEVRLDLLSLREYMKSNRAILAFLGELSAITGAEIDPIQPDIYLRQLTWLGAETLGDVQKLLENNRATALRLARQVLEGTDLDILSSNTALRYLCRAELLRTGRTEAEITDFLLLSNKNEARARQQAQNLLHTAAISSQNNETEESK